MTGSFAHLHVHTEYSRLDGASRIRELLAAAAKHGQPGVASTDHGNTFAHYEMWKQAKILRGEGTNVRAILGIEAYVAPRNGKPNPRLHKSAVRWGTAGDKGKNDAASKDVAGGGKYTHMTLLATNAQGLRALFEITSRGSMEGQYPVNTPRIDSDLAAEVIAKYPGAQLIGTTGCPSGAIQTRLRLGQFDEAVREAEIWRDILGPENYFLELMDHGNSFEKLSRNSLLQLATYMDLPLLATNDSHYTEESEAEFHDAMLCQPPGTMVERVVPQSKAGLPRAASLPIITEQVPIEDIRAGDRVVSWNGMRRRGWIRRSGSLVSEVGTREYSGDLIGVRTPTGASSRYTYDHKTIARLDAPLDGGNYVVYLMRKGDWFRVGITQYRRKSRAGELGAGGDLGPMYRLREEHGDDIWLLSVHETEDEAREQEAWVSFRYNIPTWTFTKPGMRAAGRKAFYADLWSRVGNLTDHAKVCLADFNRDIRFPLLSNGPFFVVRPQEVHACNLMSGMLVCVPTRETKMTSHGTGVWHPIEVFRESYTGPVFSMDVEEDHTYVADGIVTHNCLQQGAQISQPGTERLKFEGTGYHLRSSEEMRRLFREMPEACDNSVAIAERVSETAYDENFDYRDDLLPEFPVPAGHTPATFLRERVEVRARELYPDPEQPNGITVEASERAEYELSTIERMGYPSYMLMVADVVAWARSVGIRVGPGRGSAAGSFVSYMLGITQVPTLEHGLLFERFINPERVSPPDVDIDFEKGRRDEVFAYLAEKWGADKVCRIQTVGRLKAKQALKDAAKVLGHPFALGARLTAAYPKPVSGAEAPLSCVEDETDERYADADEFRALLDKDEGAREVFTLAKQMEGMIRSFGVHACGFIVSSKPLMGLIPLTLSEKDGAIVSGFPNSDALEPMGLLKLDALGLDTMDVIRLSRDLILTGHGIDVERDLFMLEDPDAYRILATGSTMGCFQVGSTGLTKLLQLMCADRFEDISAALALYRPGPMGVEAHTAYALRKTGRQRVKPIHRELEEALAAVLGATFGVIVYQEQIMRAAQAVAGYTLGAADLLRKAMGKKKADVLAKEKIPFFAGMKASGFSEEAAEALWQVFLPFAAYAFNIAHTVSYGFITYQTAWLKAHYPAEFMAALLTVADDKDKRALYLGECRRMGLSVKVPDVNESGIGFTPTAGTIRFGLTAIKGIGPNVVKAIIDGRADGPYKDFGDFLDRVGMAALNAKAVDALIRAGAFDSLGYTRRALAMIAEKAVKQRSNVAKKEATGQVDLFSMFAEVEGAPAFTAVIVPDEPEWERESLLYSEKEVLSLYVSGHPLDDLEPVLAGNRDQSIAELVASERTEGNAVLAGQIMSAEVKVARASGKKYARVVFADLHGEVEVMVFGQSYGVYGHMLVPDSKVRMKIRLDQRSEEEGVTYICDAVAELDHNLRAAPRQTRVIDGREAIVLNFPVGKATPERVHELRLMLDRHRGDQPVFVDLVSTDGSRQPLVLPGVGVTRSPELLIDAKALLGRDAIAA